MPILRAALNIVFPLSPKSRSKVSEFHGFFARIRDILMPTDPVALSLEEYRALRATIRERGTMRLVVAAITFVAWAALALGWSSAPVFALFPLLVLAAGFEVIFATHVGVERIGRYIQVFYEASDGLPRWEHTAMEIGGRAAAGSGIDPLFSGVFIIATFLNLIPIGLATVDEGPRLLGGVSLELVVFGLLHLAFIGRVLIAKRYADGQRAKDLDLFRNVRH